MLLLLIWNRWAPKSPKGTSERAACRNSRSSSEQPIIIIYDISKGDYSFAPTIPKRVTNGSHSETKACTFHIPDSETAAVGTLLAIPPSEVKVCILSLFPWPS
uniref:Uncharacterized protein n=1 Tax=Ombrophytum subterraneum TaxID=50155 RepID=A0A6M8PY58_9MAGN|nr:hypothetical protein [Ombrophytum subterraneum]